MRLLVTSISFYHDLPHDLPGFRAVSFEKKKSKVMIIGLAIIVFAMLLMRIVYLEGKNVF
jgi:hypothetical protein